jgi:hypothetical protein
VIEFQADGVGTGGPLLAIRRGLARPRFLVDARRERCAGCDARTRIVMVWVTSKRVVERIAWCRYCFEAECGVVTPSASEREASDQTLRAVEAQAPITWFDCARPVAEELERRGML